MKDAAKSDVHALLKKDEDIKQDILDEKNADPDAMFGEAVFVANNEDVNILYQY